MATFIKHLHTYTVHHNLSVLHAISTTLLGEHWTNMCPVIHHATYESRCIVQSKTTAKSLRRLLLADLSVRRPSCHSTLQCSTKRPALADAGNIASGYYHHCLHQSLPCFVCYRVQGQKPTTSSKDDAGVWLISIIQSSRDSTRYMYIFQYALSVCNYKTGHWQQGLWLPSGYSKVIPPRLGTVSAHLTYPAKKITTAKCFVQKWCHMTGKFV